MNKINFINYRKTSILLVWTVIFSSLAFGEKMPIKHLTIADGLPQNSINSITQDEKGFFWIGTNGGLARFDGYEFVSFTKKEGLPSNAVLDFLKTHDKKFWLATTGGLVKFSPGGKIYNRVVTGDEVRQLVEMPMFTTYRLPSPESGAVTKLLEDSKGTIWIGTERGVFKLRESDGQTSIVPAEIDNSLSAVNKRVYALYEDRSGAVWIGTENTLTRAAPDNQSKTYRIPDESPIFSTILEDRAGNLWVGTLHRGLFLFSVDENGMPRVTRQFASEPDSEIEWIDTIVEAADGKFWIGGSQGLYQFDPQANKLFRYTRASGLNYYRFQTMFEDRDGNIWLGTKTNGIYSLSTHGLISFEAEDHLSFVRSVGLDNQNNLILTAFVTNNELDNQGARVLRDITGKVAQPFLWRFGSLGENGFSWVVPKFSESISYYGSGINQLSFQARSGEWWIATGQGLYRFPKTRLADLAKTAPLDVFNEKNGLKPSDIFRIFEDSRGDVWIATSGTESNGFYKWEHETKTLRDMTLTEGFAAVKDNLISAFDEDRKGNIWLGFYAQGLARLRNGRIEFWDNERDGSVIPQGGIASLFFDRQDRLWAATRQGGILRVDNPSAESPEFTNYTEANGLSSNRTLSITQDKQNLIYIGTDHNISRFNPQTNEFKILNLAKDQLQREYRSAVCDRSGTLWFGTSEGLIKYLPVPDKPMPPPEVLVIGVLVEGVPQPVPATGAAEINLPTLSPQQNQIRINYVSLAGFEDENIRYQYKFNDEEWSPPEKERFVNFANLSAGNYEVFIRAIASGGAPGENSAAVSFRILPPVYLRWWFFALAFLLAALIVYAFYRTRLQKLLEMERARTLIASDLHDDIGANLSKISVLSEVARMKMRADETGDQDQNRLLNSIAEISRESVASMSDIVWAINPKRDSALEMIRKMREYAEGIFIPKGIGVKFTEPEKAMKIKLPMDLRRELYLIFKEAVNNAAKHSGATLINIIFQIENGMVVLKIADDGGGFETNLEAGGNGLINMQNRAQKLKGKFECRSQIGGGTTIEIHVPQN